MIDHRHLKIAVFGANGYVAKNLRELLHFKKIDSVSSISRSDFKSYAKENKILISNLDNSISCNLRNYDVLIHLVGSGRQTINSDHYDINTDLTKQIIKICKNSNIKKIIYISGLGTAENSTICYFISKYRAERDIINSGLNYTIFRPSYIIGKQDPLSTKIINHATLHNNFCIPGSGNYLIQPIFIGDAIEIIFDSIINPLFNNGIFDLVGPEILNFREFINIFKETKKMKHRIQFTDLEYEYFNALHSSTNTYCVDDLNILIGSFIGNCEKIQKLSGIKLKNVNYSLAADSIF
ncbi:MAG: NAD(P)H-binding protein [Nitrosopumilaceae archaeon]|nr:NAD(P)H-binding protein [Nitrosopumilaceae archaeon]